MTDGDRKSIAFIKGALIGYAVGALLSGIVTAMFTSGFTVSGRSLPPSVVALMFLSRSGPALGLLIGGFLAQNAWKPSE